MVDEGHYRRMRRKTLRLMTDPIEKGRLGWPRQTADARLGEWDVEGASRDDDRERLDYWKDGLRWIREKYRPSDS